MRRKGHVTSRTYRLKADAEKWAREIEDRLDRGGALLGRSTLDGIPNNLSGLIKLHIADMLDVRRPPRRSKRYCLERLARELGHWRIPEITHQRLIDYGRHRFRDGAGPATLGMEISYLGTVLRHAAAIHGISVSSEHVELARVALKRLGLVGNSSERTRRPTQDELDAIIPHLQLNTRQIIPVWRIVKFAVATTMRLEEITRIQWTDFDHASRLIMIRDRKDPRRKSGNDQQVPLLSVTGYDAVQLIEEQANATGRVGRIFPYKSQSIGTAFRRACQELGIKNLRFHDLRHEGTSRLFEAGLALPEVALVTGHKDWKMLKRYLNLRPEGVVRRYETLNHSPENSQDVQPDPRPLSKIERVLKS